MSRSTVVRLAVALALAAAAFTTVGIVVREVLPWMKVAAWGLYVLVIGLWAGPGLIGGAMWIWFGMRAVGSPWGWFRMPIVGLLGAAGAWSIYVLVSLGENFSRTSVALGSAALVASAWILASLRSSPSRGG